MGINKAVQTLRNKQEKVDKYLTDIKELPPTSGEDVAVKKTSTPKKLESAKIADRNEFASVEIQEANKNKVTGPKQSVDNSVEVKKDPVKLDEETGISTSVFTFKDIILGIINIISIALIIFLLFKLPQKATEFQTEKIEEIRNQISPQSEFGNITEDNEKATKLNELFLDESGVVRFVGDVEKLKSENGAISKVTFASPKAVKDELGLMGIPVTIELRGNWDTFGPAMEKIQGLPYLFRPISINAGPSKDDPSVLILNYGVFLYVNDETT